MTLDPAVAFLLGVSLTQLLYALLMFKIVTRGELQNLTDFLLKKYLARPRSSTKQREKQISGRKVK